MAKRSALHDLSRQTVALRFAIDALGRRGAGAHEHYGGKQRYCSPLK
jgi:hypothetical protein